MNEHFSIFSSCTSAQEEHWRSGGAGSWQSPVHFVTKIISLFKNFCWKMSIIIYNKWLWIKNTLKILFDWGTFLAVLCFSAVLPFSLCQFAIQKDMYHFHVSDHRSHVIGLSLYDWLSVISFKYKFLKKVHCNLFLYKPSDLQANTYILYEY